MQESQKYTIVEAVCAAMRDSLLADENVLLFGEDVGKNGGVFRASVGLQEQFGSDRVFDAPLAENLIAGMAIGLAASGFKPIIEAQFSGFIYPMLDPILNHASRLRHRTQGRLSCPMVLRAPSGGGIHAPEHHSESNEALFAHIPGLRVVMPSTPQRAYSLLKAAIFDPDPVIFFEPTRLYRLFTQPVDLNLALPLDKAFIEQTGTDITLISWGGTMVECRKVATQAAQEGISIELIDLATLKPIDSETLVASVMKTGRAVIVHEAAQTGGLGAEVAAILADKAFAYLKAPIKRVCGFDTIMPLYRLEKTYLPSEKRIYQAIAELV